MLNNLDKSKWHVVEKPRLILLLKEDLGYLSFMNSITACLGSMLLSFRISNRFGGSLAVDLAVLYGNKLVFVL